MTTSTPQYQAQATMLVNRVRKNMRRLKGWRTQHGVTCYRMYDADIPELPFRIDHYEGRLYFADVRSPSTDDGDAADRLLEACIVALCNALGLPRDAVAIKRRIRQKGRQQYARLQRSDQRFPVGEGGLRFLVNLTDYLDTGLFLDHRRTRALVRDESDGCRFLNLFSYTGAFTVYAAHGGAAASTSVDLSQNYLDWAADNLALNRLDGKAHRWVRADVMAWTLEAAGRGEAYDLVVCDPPTFSNSKRTDTVLDIGRDHGELLRRVHDIVNPGGVVWFSTNARRFRLDDSLAHLFTMTEMIDSTISPDFRGRPHRCWRMVKAS
ncbi:MAG: class I SAM-dependent methyltransferase [Myxococcota bacterium]|nr:class I SAM-dependent methyltransferase [Myxococcota bacterium]